jgi:NitT/TauT family transport system substrate-binding protein
MVGSVGQKSGEIPYTCFMANPSFISKNSKKIESFLAAIKKAYDYIISNDSATVAQSLQPSFSSTSLESLAQAVDSYKAIDAWCSSPVMTDDSYSRLIAVMQNAGEIDKDVPFSSVVDNTYASKI